MDIPSVNRPVHTDQVPLDRLMQNPNVSQEQKLDAVGRHFEAIFVREILKHAQKTVISSSITHDTAASGIYKDMLQNMMADSISSSGALGIKQMVASELRRLNPVATEPSDPEAARSGEPDQV